LFSAQKSSVNKALEWSTPNLQPLCRDIISVSPSITQRLSLDQAPAWRSLFKLVMSYYLINNGIHYSPLESSIFVRFVTDAKSCLCLFRSFCQPPYFGFASPTFVNHSRSAFPCISWTTQLGFLELSFDVTNDITDNSTHLLQLDRSSIIVQMMTVTKFDFRVNLNAIRQIYPVTRPSLLLRRYSSSNLSAPKIAEDTLACFVSRFWSKLSKYVFDITNIILPPSSLNSDDIREATMALKTKYSCCE
jgi:hypothetical protein